MATFDCSVEADIVTLTQEQARRRLFTLCVALNALAGRSHLVDDVQPPGGHRLQRPACEPLRAPQWQQLFSLHLQESVTGEPLVEVPGAQWHLHDLQQLARTVAEAHTRVRAVHKCT
jgi:hypothetical protein